jgi:putative DNA primase/helicase
MNRIVPLDQAPRLRIVEEIPAKDNLNGESLPTIRLEAGNIEAVVDDVEWALIRARRGLYQRGGLIVSVGHEPALAAHGRDVVVQRIAERGDHALLEDISASARFERFDARAKDFITKDPPMALAKTLKQRFGRLRLPALTGIVNAPTMRADGSLLTEPGYDDATGLLFDPLDVDFPPLAGRPTRRDAEDGLARLNNMVDSFPFVEEQDRSVALSAVLTACVRRSLPTAPLHAFTAPVAGSGKSKLVDIASVIAFGHEAAVLAQGHTEEELEKRLGAVLLAGDGAVSLDNCERPLAGELLCQMLTQTRVQPRILGKSQAPDLSTNTFVSATGNNLRLAGDLTRRALLCRLDPKVERPETRFFEWEPVTVAKARRPELVAAALTTLHAFHTAGRPKPPPALGSFEGWSDLVRGTLLWLGCADPVATMDELRKADPKLDDLQSVIAQWQTHIGADRVTVAEAIKCATETDLSGYGSSTGFLRPDFREALIAVAGQGGAINSRRLGKWLSATQNRIVNGVCFQNVESTRGVAVWVLR